MQKLTVTYARVSRVWEEAHFTIEVPDGATKAEIEAAAESHRMEHSPEFKETESWTDEVKISTSPAA